MCSQVLPPRHDKARCFAIIALGLAPFAFGFLALALGQDANWDLRNYHWYNAYAFLAGRYDADFLPSQIPSFYNPILDIPFYLLATHVSSKTAGFILGSVQGVNFILLFMIAYVSLILKNKLYQTWICLALACLGMLGGGGVALIGTTFGDNITSLGILLTTLFVILSRQNEQENSWKRLSLEAFLYGVIPGLMMGLKLPNVVFCVGLCFAYLGGSEGWLKKIRLSFMFGLGVLLGLTLAFGHWALYLESHFGSPLFPYFNDYFKSPMLGLTNMRDTKFLPHGLKEVLTFPFLFANNPFRVGEIPWRDWRIPLLYLLLPLSLLIHFKFHRQDQETLINKEASRYLLWMGVLSYATWLMMFAIYRYAIPLEMLAPLLIVCALGLWPLSNSKRLLCVAFLFGIIIVTIVPGNWTRRISWTDHFVETGIPPLGDTSNLIVLMAGIEPYSHLIPQFPAAISFVRIESNFTSPDQENGINRLLRERLSSHKGRFMMMIPAWNKEEAHRAMAYFKLDFDAGPCQMVQDKLYDKDDIELCPVHRLNMRP